MPFVQDFYGVGGDLFIELNRQPTDADLWEILGFCRRYGIDKSQLAKFETDENRGWMHDPNSIWYAEVHGHSTSMDGS
ncbi:hypothetical protein [Sphingomonas sp. PB4P5]|uniref:hypothetical protein n=1 Tax=Parasphingomonas puruogangriensis TaxID=3096155 RepID=UPI002FC7C29A